MERSRWRIPAILWVALGAASLGGCGLFPAMDERECLARAMYFESNRSSEAGMFAVGTVVMNRVNSGRYPRSICGVVGQPKQFAPGVLRKPMTGKAKVRATKVANAVLSGQRYPGLRGVMHFHTADTSYPRPRLNYVTIAGGNAFYYHGGTTVVARTSTRPAAPVSIAVASQRRMPIALPPPSTPQAAPDLPPPQPVEQVALPGSSVGLPPPPPPQSIDDLLAQTDGLY